MTPGAGKATKGRIGPLQLFKHLGPGPRSLLPLPLPYALLCRRKPTMTYTLLSPRGS